MSFLAGVPLPPLTAIFTYVRARCSKALARKPTEGGLTCKVPPPRTATFTYVGAHGSRARSHSMGHNAVGHTATTGYQIHTWWGTWQ